MVIMVMRPEMDPEICRNDQHLLIFAKSKTTQDKGAWHLNLRKSKRQQPLCQNPRPPSKFAANSVLPSGVPKGSDEGEEEGRVG